MTGYRPRLGDVIRLPEWLPGWPYRVLSVGDDVFPGWVELNGYLIEPHRIQVKTYRTPVSYLRQLPDPTWGRP